MLGDVLLDLPVSFHVIAGVCRFRRTLSETQDASVFSMNHARLLHCVLIVATASYFGVLVAHCNCAFVRCNPVPFENVVFLSLLPIHLDSAPPSTPISFRSGVNLFLCPASRVTMRLAVLLRVVTPANEFAT